MTRKGRSGKLGDDAAALMISWSMATSMRRDQRRNGRRTCGELCAPSLYRYGKSERGSVDSIAGGIGGAEGRGIESRSRSSARPLRDVKASRKLFNQLIWCNAIVASAKGRLVAQCEKRSRDMYNGKGSQERGI